MARADNRIGPGSVTSGSSRRSSEPARRAPQQRLGGTSRERDGSDSVDAREPRRVSRMIGAALVIAVLAGCGVSGNDANQAVGAAAKAAQGATRLSEHAMRSWCPAAVDAGGRQLTQAQARACLQRAWNGWLNELKRNGFNPRQMAQGR